MQKESDFAANVDSGWLSWGVGLLLVRPLKWTLSTLLGSGRVPLEESFVVIELVKVSVSLVQYLFVNGTTQPQKKQKGL